MGLKRKDQTIIKEIILFSFNDQSHVHGFQPWLERLVITYLYKSALAAGLCGDEIFAQPGGLQS